MLTQRVHRDVGRVLFCSELPSHDSQSSTSVVWTEISATSKSSRKSLEKILEIVPQSTHRSTRRRRCLSLSLSNVDDYVITAISIEVELKQKQEKLRWPESNDDFGSWIFNRLRFCDRSERKDGKSLGVASELRWDVFKSLSAENSMRMWEQNDAISSFRWQQCHRHLQREKWEFREKSFFVVSSATDFVSEGNFRLIPFCETFLFSFVISPLCRILSFLMATQLLVGARASEVYFRENALRSEKWKKLTKRNFSALRSCCHSGDWRSCFVNGASVFFCAWNLISPSENTFLQFSESSAPSAAESRSQFLEWVLDRRLSRLQRNKWRKTHLQSH